MNIKKIGRNFLVFFVIIVGLIFFILSNQIGGWRAFVVSSGSMQPTIKTGSLILSQYVDPTTLKIGDVITFIPPLKEKEFVTHRIAKIEQTKNPTAFKTKGDAKSRLKIWRSSVSRISAPQVSGVWS